ncbi:MAG: hypothetical protein QXN26_03280 [Thermoplasmataceae archaeon]
MSGFSMMGFMPLYSGFPMVMAHMFFGILIGLLSMGIIFLSIETKARRNIMVAVGLFLSVLLAGINCLFFLFACQHNLNSYLMSTGFILAIFFSVLLLIFAGPGGLYSGKIDHQEL